MDLVDDSIPHIEFACDLGRCKGACCTMPGPKGAPLLDYEVEEIERWFPTIRKYLSYRHKDTIEERGLVQGRKGEYTTQVVDRRACVFAYFAGDIAKCAFEKAFLDNEIGWRKPISCHLFPIRVSSDPPYRLRYDSIAECGPALERGSREGIKLSEFLAESLIRAFGQEWYEEFQLYCEQKRNATLKL